jgi:hypothetical protein
VKREDRFIQPAWAIHIIERAACPRCHGPMFSHSCSWFTDEDICSDCQQDERHAPNYAAARAAEAAAVRRGDYNFRGIGLAPEDVEALAAARRRRS